MKRRYFSVSIISLLASCWLTLSAVAAISVEVANAPESDLALTLKAIDSAKRHLIVNIYEFTSPSIADALVKKIRSGVQVEVLAENQPVGGLSAEGKAVQQRVVAAMNESGGDHYYVMTSKATLAKRRFRFDHAKYVVSDGDALLIGSENYSPSGHPKNGEKGNRGWEVFIHDRNLAQEYAQMFSSDTSLAFNDVMDLAEDTQKTSPLDQVQGAEPTAEPGLPALAVKKITSPENSQSSLVDLLNSAQKSIDIQQMTFSSDWGEGFSPLLDAVKAAAKRGVKVRVLLNDETVFSHTKTPVNSKNLPTIAELQVLANEGYKVYAKTADLKAMGVEYIHNKGLLVDGDKTLISSINWDENSVLNNREAAVVISSPAVNQYFSALFDRDWAFAGKAP